MQRPSLMRFYQRPSAISKARKGIGLLKYLSKYLPRHTLNELYKLYVRPHLDYGDVIYYIPAKACEFSQNIILPNVIEKLESVQYIAALRLDICSWFNDSI